MIPIARHLSFGCAAVLCAALVTGCGSDDAGATLTVDVWDGPDPVQISRSPVPADASVTFTARVTYRGTKDLQYNWAVVQFPASTGWAVDPDDSNPAEVTFTMSGEGVYVLQLEVFETNGTISASDRVTFVLDDPATPGTPRGVASNG